MHVKKKVPGKSVCRIFSTSRAAGSVLLLSGVFLVASYSFAESISAETMLEYSSLRLITGLGEKGYHDTSAVSYTHLRAHET